ncbi:MAG: DUF1592 domain-containing protein [Acidobacteriota bacterium]|jgi:hypothetical protein|nr:DUF1592 domain-containing protein [Bryobacteraceae bacterium CoA2 C42]
MLRLAAFFPVLLLAQEPVIDRYCKGCHNAQTKVAGLALDTVKADDAASWEKVLRRVRGRTMPPAGLPRPGEAEYEGLVARLEKRLDARPMDPGRTDTFRRLNRTEYQNAIRDLLAVEVDVTGLLPADDVSRGFDNVTVGNLSPTLLERYLGAARKIGRLAIGIAPKQAGGETVLLPPDLTQEEHFEGLPLGTRGGTAVRYTFPLDAEYEIQVRLQRDRNEHVEGLRGQHTVELLLDGERIQAFVAKPPAPGKDHAGVDREFNVRVRVSAGPHTVAAVFPKQASAMLETERQPYQAHFNMDRHPRITPAVFSVTVNGPYNAKGPGDTPSRRAIFVCSTQDEACATRIVSRLARRAYRRPVRAADLAVPMRFFRETQGKEGFEAGIEMALRAVLVSPEFLFRVEQDPAGVKPGTAYRISELELASRLSFFLWSSIPDEELLGLAERGELRKPGVLSGQVRRMLGDERARMLVTNFADQWLQLRNVAAATPDMRAFPDFDDNLRKAFRRETHLFLESVLREDRSVTELLRANYSFLNERLAKHYGVAGVYGSRFRKVTFGEGAERGGLLRQGSILTVTSYATRTSPVIRGKWVLDNILGVPPPPPPPNVPALEETKAAMKKMTVRERLAEHRRNPACAGCHKLMDPVGFALENYDAVGRWRRAEDGVPVDVSGGLPDGAQFSGVAGLEKALLTRPELFATTVTEKLLTYALGRGVEFTDAPAVRQIVRQAERNNFRFSSLLEGIAGSPSFQMRRAQ